MSKDDQVTPEKRQGAGRDLLPLLVGLALLLGLAGRLLAGFQAPLWFDETYSAAIASLPDFKGLLDFCLTELSGPTHYMILWGWEKIAGNSNVALRIPSLIFSLLAPLVILWRGHPDGKLRYLWAAVVALWIPAFGMSSQARPYTLLFLFACLQAMAFLRLMDAPDRRRAAIWLLWCSLAMLTHYYALFLCGVQGLLYLIRWRGRAVASWPALAVLAPMLLWMGFHLPFVLLYSKPDTVWYGLLEPKDLLFAPVLMFGPWLGAPLCFLALLLTGLYLAVRSPREANPLTLSAESALALSGFLAFALIYALGFVRPSFTARYLLSTLPAILFGLALWLRWLGERRALLQTAALALILGGAVIPLLDGYRRPQDDFRYHFNMEQPSAWMRDHGVKHLLFLWDNPAMSMMDDPRFHGAMQRNTQRVAGFFFQRSGHPVSVDVVPRPGPGIDPNSLLLARAKGGEPTGILWVSNSGVPGTRAIRYPPRIDRIDPRWTCRNFGKERMSILACTR